MRSLLVDGRPPHKVSSNRILGKAVITLVVLLLVAYIVILLLSAPEPLTMDIEGTVERFPIPENLTLHFFPVKRIHLRGLGMKMTGIDTVAVENETKGTKVVPLRQLRIEGDGGTGSGSAMLTLKDSSRVGVMVPAGVLLEAKATGSSGLLQIILKGSGMGVLGVSLRAKEIGICGLAGVVVRPPLVKGSAGGFGPCPSPPPLVVRNPLTMVGLTSPCAGECSFYVETDERYPPFEGAMQARPKAGEPLWLMGAAIDVLALHGVSSRDVDVVLSLPTDVEILPGKGFRWTNLEVAHRRQDPPGGIGFRGQGPVLSVRQSGRELLPSRAAVWLSSDPKSRGLHGGLALLLIFLWGIVFKKAVDLIMDQMLGR